MVICTAQIFVDTAFLEVRGFKHSAFQLVHQLNAVQKVTGKKKESIKKK